MHHPTLNFGIRMVNRWAQVHGPIMYSRSPYMKVSFDMLTPPTHTHTPTHPHTHTQTHAYYVVNTSTEPLNLTCLGSEPNSHVPARVRRCCRWQCEPVAVSSTRPRWRRMSFESSSSTFCVLNLYLARQNSLYNRYTMLAELPPALVCGVLRMSDLVSLA